MSANSACSSLGGRAFSEPAPAGVATDAARRGSYDETARRCTDVVGSAAILLACAPLLALLAIGVKLSGPGPVFSSQRRLGRGGSVFHCYTFRTTVADADFDAPSKIKKGPRVTPFGALLRRTSLDELPQLWNVLRGDMSLIGPRPSGEGELSEHGGLGEKLLTVRPGLGGPWQASGRSDTTDHERIAMGMTYVESRSLALDLRLIAQTALVAVLGRA